MARTKTVLLVTNPGLVRNVTSAGLSLYGYDVLTAAPEEAVESLRVNRHTAVVVIDADLSGQDGDVARFARSINPKIDVVYTSRMPHRAAATLLPGAPILRNPLPPAPTCECDRSPEVPAGRADGRICRLVTLLSDAKTQKQITNGKQKPDLGGSAATVGSGLLDATRES